MEKLTSAFNEMRTSTVNGLSADPWIAWSASVAANADKVVQSYNNQKSALDNSVATLQRFADEGGNVAEIQRIMAQGSGNLANQYSLLDEQDLSKLRSAMDSANDKLREMQQEAQDAQTALAELNAEILAEQGNTAAADKLKLQISQTSALTELERKLAEARGIGNKELIAIYQQQINKTNELYALKNRNLDAEIAGNDKTTKTNQAAITSANALTSAMKQSAEAVKILNGADLSGLVESSGQALNNFKAIKGLM